MCFYVLFFKVIQKIYETFKIFHLFYLDFFLLLLIITMVAYFVSWDSYYLANNELTECSNQKQSLNK